MGLRHITKLFAKYNQIKTLYASSDCSSRLFSAALPFHGKRIAKAIRYRDFAAQKLGRFSIISD